ncbi:hypothetical protein DXG01_012003 [Tephrocybe rancida]|nr:hypothetical protein DXG01_012003 [Tephrocybe rancida]
MASPPNSPIQPQGASRISGGIFRGHAVGNAFNYADLKDLQLTVLGPVKGKVHLFVSNSDPALVSPSHASPSMTFKQEVLSSLSPILKKMAQSYPPIKKSNHQIFVYEDGLWIIKGHYNSAVDENDEIDSYHDVALILRQSSFEPESLSLLQDDGAPSAEGHPSSSISVSGFSTPASGLQTPASEAGISTASQGSTFISSAKRELMKKLGISEHLANHTITGLPFAYQKYLVYLKATKALEEMVNARTWIGKRPAGSDIIELFTSRTMWFDSYKPNFSKVHAYPTMVAWLTDESGGPSNLEAWGVEKTKYTFKDLAGFLENEGHLGEGGGKGKSKAREKKHKEKDQKASVEADEGKTKGSEKKSKKKAKKGSK